VARHQLAKVANVEENVDKGQSRDPLQVSL
jgi:hypothetical protein